MDRGDGPPPRGRGGAAVRPHCDDDQRARGHDRPHCRGRARPATRLPVARDECALHRVPARGAGIPLSTPGEESRLKMEKRKLVVVGNGMAGARVLEELLEIAPGLYDIAVFGAEPHPNYNRILLSPVLAGADDARGNILEPVEGDTANGPFLPPRKTGAQNLPPPRRGHPRGGTRGPARPPRP